MSDPAAVNSILEDLAAGRISAADAATKIADLQREPEPTVVNLESLYDTPPARVLDEPAAPVDEPAVDPGWPAPDPADRAEPVDEAPAEAPAADEQPATDEQPKSDDEKVVFSLQMDDLASTAGDVIGAAGDVLGAAGGFALGALHKLGQFAGSVIPDAAPAPAPADQAAPRPDAGPRPTGSRGIEKLVLRSVGRRVKLVGDPRVATISVDGPHSLRRQGVTLEVSTEGEIGINLDSFSVIRPPKTLEDLRVIGFGQELVVRVNPSIPVEAEVVGARLTTVDVPYLGKIRVSAGGANLSGVVQITDALMQAGGATLSGPLSEGRSRVRVESGNLSLNLTKGANVTIRSQTQLGRVSWPGEPHGELDEFVVGNGSAQLEIGVVMGRAVVRVEE